MKLKGFATCLLGCVAFSVSSIVPLHAATIANYSGTLANDAAVFEGSFSLSGASSIVIASDSYGGGTLGGVTTAAGGFVPVISLFSSTGAFIASDGADGVCRGSMQRDSASKMCDDAMLNANLSAGSYLVTVSEFPNYLSGKSLNLGNAASSFQFSGQGNFTGGFCGTTGGFYETDKAPCLQRTSSYFVNVSTPEPGTAWLCLPAIGLFFWRRLRRGV